MSDAAAGALLPDDPCTPVQVVAADGASVRFCAHGGHVLGWTPAGGEERLWLSRATGCGPGTAVRGGVPVVWPQFAERGDGPRHGVVRDRAWQVVRAGAAADGAAEVRLRLVADASTTPFPHPFTLTLDVRAEAATLGLRLEAVNDGAAPFSFTAALHTYLRVSSAAAARVAGLEGLVAVPNDGGAPWTVDGPVGAVGPVDVALAGTEAREVVVVDPVLGDVGLSGLRVRLAGGLEPRAGAGTGRRARRRRGRVRVRRAGPPGPGDAGSGRALVGHGGAAGSGRRVGVAP